MGTCTIVSSYHPYTPVLWFKQKYIRDKIRIQRHSSFHATPTQGVSSCYLYTNAFTCHSYAHISSCHCNECHSDRNVSKCHFYSIFSSCRTPTCPSFHTTPTGMCLNATSTQFSLRAVPLHASVSVPLLQECI